MIDPPPESLSDVWSEWLLHHRHADDAAFAHAVRAEVESYADRVLDAARLSPGMTLVDVGTGEGLLAWRAIDRIGPSLRVVLTDVSAPMLRHAEALAVQRGIREQCTFMRCPADALDGIADACVDVVATRAVLAYVPDKIAALREFHRVLMPGGRLSIAEPILQDDAFLAIALKMMTEKKPARPQDAFLPLLHRWKAAQYPDTHEGLAANPLVNYSERNLLQFARQAGFVELHLELHIDVCPSIMTSWEVFLGSSPHPLAPPLRVILAERFTPEERATFERVMRPTIESSQAISTTRIAFLSASKPSARQ